MEVSLKDGEMAWKASEHDSEGLLAYAGALRRVLMEGEMVRGQNVHGVARRHVTDDDIVAKMDESNRLWSNRVRQATPPTPDCVGQTSPVTNFSVAPTADMR